MKVERPSLFRVRPDPEIVPMRWKYSGSMVDLYSCAAARHERRRELFGSWMLDFV